MGDKCKVFVGNLSYDVGTEELRDHFSEVGTVQDCVVINDRDTGRPRGFGFVTFSTEDEARRAKEELNSTDFLGRQLTVKEAENKGGSGRSRGGGGYGGGGGGYRGGGGGYGGGGGGYGGGGGGYGGRSGGYGRESYDNYNRSYGGGNRGHEDRY